ncbi:MAG: ATP-binding protein [Anaerolineae bacterium]|nr:ATP-binding protein [Anaerolineae bacterium]
MFWNRQQELNSLESIYARPGGQLVVIYGRRRVGKTALIREFAQDKPLIFFLADKQMETVQLMALRREVATLFPTAERLEPTWDNLLSFVGDQAGQESDKLVLVLDEFQYLAQVNPAVPSILQRLWDLHLHERNLMLILCGSLVGMMFDTCLAYSSPLYGRRTGALKLKPLRFHQVRQIFHAWPFEEVVRLYAVTGGVPHYIRMLGVTPDDEPDDIISRIAQAVLQPSALLYDEPRFILSGELAEPITYFSILQAIAAGEHRLGKIAGALGVQTSRITRYLNVLADLDLVERRVPVTVALPTRTRRGLWTITDHFFRFWFRYVFPHQGDLEMGRTDEVLRQMRQTFDAQFVAAAFEDACADLVMSGSLALPFHPLKVGAWWDKNAEIDLVALNEETGEILFGECKWTEQPVGMGVLQHLYAASRRVPWRKDARREWFVIFSRAGFQEELVARAQRPGDVGYHDVLLVQEA